MAALEHYYRELATGRRSGLADRMVLAALTVPAFCYGVVLRLRAIAYHLGILRSHQLPRPVISVGNLSVGGTGKTPMVAQLSRFLLGRGKRVVVLSRGYGGTAHGETHIVSDGSSVFLTAEEAGDEPYLLATSVPGLMVVIGPDRYRAGLLAMEKLSPDVFILDDGFQHLRLRRDLNILLLDATAPFGNGRTFPAGLLREPPAASARADLVVFSRCKSGVRVAVAEKPSCCASHRLTGARLLPEGKEEAFSALRTLRGVAFAGIAEPAGFFDQLADVGLQLVATLAFPDHSRYGEAEIASLSELCERFQADYLITTGKDGVKLGPYLSRLGRVYAAGLELRLADSTPLEEALARILN